MLKILQARLQQYMNFELPDVQAGFRKGIETRDQIAKIHWIIKKKKKTREFQEEKKKKFTFCFMNYMKAFDCVSQQTGKFFRRWEYQTTWPGSWEIFMQVRKQELQLDIEQHTGSK